MELSRAARGSNADSCPIGRASGNQAELSWPILQNFEKHNFLISKTGCGNKHGSITKSRSGEGGH